MPHRRRRVGSGSGRGNESALMASPFPAYTTAGLDLAAFILLTEVRRGHLSGGGLRAGAPQREGGGPVRASAAPSMLQ